MKQTSNVKNKANVAAGQRKPTPTTNATSTAQPFSTPDVSTTTNKFSWWIDSRLSGRVLIPLRLFLGVTFVYAGIQKLTDPQFFNRSAAGFIGKQILAFATGSPIHNFLIYAALPHATFFGALVAFGEIAIGVGTLIGFLFRPAAFAGILLSLMFFLSASWRVHPYFYGADIVFVFAWIPLLLAGPCGSGLPTLDAQLAPRVLRNVPPEWRRRLGPAFNFLLGVGADVVDKEILQSEEMPAQATHRTTGQAAAYNSRVSGYPQGVPQHIISGQAKPGYAQGTPQQPKQVNYKGRNAAIRRSQESRRNFLWGLVVGGLGMLGIAVAGKAVQSLPFGRDDSATTTQSGGSTTGGEDGSGLQSTPGSGTATTTTGGTSGTGSEIAQVSAVQPNSAVTFTIPSNGDPGVLVRLNNGKFVAFDAVCTHAGCPVQYDPTSQHLLCPCHGAEFDPSNAAAVVQGPTNTPLPGVPIRVDNQTGAITLQ